MKEHTQAVHDQLDRLIKARAEHLICGTPRTERALSSAATAYRRAKARSIKVKTDDLIRSGRYNRISKAKV